MDFTTLPPVHAAAALQVDAAAVEREVRAFPRGSGFSLTLAVLVTKIVSNSGLLSTSGQSGGHSPVGLYSL